jgi:uncharacterized 2Fe-2S/4Fe-4S cluster protein (DUF4445 family)
MYGIALDVGTSGFRAQLIDLKTKEVVKTSMTRNIRCREAM